MALGSLKKHEIDVKKNLRNLENRNKSLNLSYQESPNKKVHHSKRLALFAKQKLNELLEIKDGFNQDYTSFIKDSNQQSQMMNRNGLMKDTQNSFQEKKKLNISNSQMKLQILQQNIKNGFVSEEQIKNRSRPQTSMASRFLLTTAKSQIQNQDRSFQGTAQKGEYKNLMNERLSTNKVPTQNPNEEFSRLHSQIMSDSSILQYQTQSMLISNNESRIQKLKDLISRQNTNTLNQNRASFVEQQLDQKMKQVFNAEDRVVVNVNTNGYKRKYQIDQHSLTKQSTITKHEDLSQLIQNPESSIMSKQSSPNLRNMISKKHYHSSLLGSKEQLRSISAIANKRQRRKNSDIKDFYITGIIDSGLPDRIHVRKESDSESEDEKELRLKNQERLNDLKYQVQVNLNQEYKRHKLALGSLKMLRDLQLEWDIAFQDDTIPHKTVLKFMNQKEMSLYFEISDQLTKKLESRGDIKAFDKLEFIREMKDIAKVSRDFLSFLRDQDTHKNVEGIQENNQNRGLIRAYLFDSLWKNLMMTIDDTINHVETTATDRAQKALKKFQGDQKQQQSIIDDLKLQMIQLKASQKIQLDIINAKMNRLAQERDNCLRAIQDYRDEVGQLTNFNQRDRALGEMKEAYNQISDLINQSENERSKQMTTISQFLGMLEIGSKSNKKLEQEIQTDLSLIGGQERGIITQLDAAKLQNLGKNSITRFIDTQAKLKDSTLDDVVKQLNYILTEKARKDLIDKKQNKRITNIVDFACGVTLTNSNSYKGSKQQLYSYIQKLNELPEMNFVIGRVLGVNSFQKLSDGLIDAFLQHRLLFIDKVEAPQNSASQLILNGNGQVDYKGIIDFILDQYSFVIIKLFINVFRIIDFVNLYWRIYIQEIKMSIRQQKDI
ncbi:UNKNOWN [Stylonychia lemnae]|uniref:Uncharacterized protein n=1 Tax=Stylonychia lemnae TaxID=5949 RepID=A0A078AL41_STYLE|nr:UNKNOWN [Stylonychia lemnae]|eukprot:CDW82596.1 UNKNOWN [Stylonychia lemnae]